jgi:hypothetical protein
VLLAKSRFNEINRLAFRSGAKSDQKADHGGLPDFFNSIDPLQTFVLSAWG